LYRASTISIYYPTNALNYEYINRSFVKTNECLKIFLKSCSNMFRITQDPLSGSDIQYSAKITDNGSIVQVITDVLSKYRISLLDDGCCVIRNMLEQLFKNILNAN
jgi:hypothetical protein